MPMRMIHGMRYMHFMQKPDANEIANQMINSRDKDGDGALNADELGKLSDRLGLVEADFNEEGLIDQETLVSKISEKLEKMHGFPKMRGLKIYREYMYEQMATGIDNESVGVIAETESNSETESTGVVAETESSSETESVGVVAETESNSETESTGVVAETESSSETESVGVVAETESNSETESTGMVAETKSISDLVKQLLSQLDLSEEETESLLETLRNYGINVNA